MGAVQRIDEVIGEDTRRVRQIDKRSNPTANRNFRWSPDRSV